MQRVESLGSGEAASAKPNEAAAVELAEKPRGRRGPTPAKWLLFASIVFAVTLLALLGASAARIDRGTCAWLALLGFGFSALLCLLALVSSLGAAYRSAGTGTALPSIGMIALSFVMMCFGAFVALTTAIGFARGRQLRRFGRVLLPPLARSRTWLGAALHVQNAAGAPQGLAEQWRENGRTEHASVASFARLTLDLMALGAPPALILAANQDALDEVRHTEACFALAHALDGREESPGPFPAARSAHTVPRARALALPALAITSLVDGALHEGVSARVLGKLARRAENPQIIDILKQLAADEGRHAAHGWDVVEWCLAEGGSGVAHALAGAARALPAQMRSNLPRPAQSGAWEAWGIHGEALEKAEYARARADVIGRVQGLVARALREEAAA
jgi:hypothetical protein